MKIIRTKNRVAGGITAQEKARMDDHAKLWIGRAMRFLVRMIFMIYAPS